MRLQAQAEKGADAPFAIMHGEALHMTDVREVEYHRQTEELVIPQSHNRATTGNDDLREMIVKRYADIAE